MSTVKIERNLMRKVDSVESFQNNQMFFFSKHNPSFDPKECE